MRTRTLESALRKWEKGKLTKEQIEESVLGKTGHKGKAITRVWRNRLGVDTRFGKVKPVKVSA